MRTRLDVSRARGLSRFVGRSDDMAVLDAALSRVHESHAQVVGIVAEAGTGLEAIAKFAKTGEKPQKTPGLDFYDTGATLVTDKPVPGVPSITTDEGLKLCWG